MFVVFFLLATILGTEGFQTYNNATTIMQQIAGASIGGTGLVMVLAGVLDAWCWIFRNRLAALQKAVEAAPSLVASEIDAALSRRASQRQQRGD